MVHGTIYQILTTIYFTTFTEKEVNDMNNTRFAIGAFLIAFIFIGIMTFIQAGPGISEDNDEEKRTIDVSGSATLTANPDKAELYLSVTKQELSAKEAQAFVTEKMNAVRKSLIAAGVSSS